MYMEDLKVKVSVENLDEFKELLSKAQKETEQLKETVELIEQFKFEVDSCTQ